MPPTIREIAKDFGFSSTGTVRDYLKALTAKGFIKTSPYKSRSIQLIKDSLFSFPIVGNVQAGLPTLAVEEIEEYLNLDSLIFSEDNVFALRVKGESMTGAGIMPNDLVLVKQQNTALSGDMIVALVGDEATVKNLKNRNGHYFLEPSNERFQPILVDESVSIIGKVVSVVRRF